MSPSPHALPQRGDTSIFEKKDRHFGLWRGVVETNIDPLKQGRCQVRVVAIHGTEVSISATNLPWALPRHALGGFHDGGSYLVPPVGATVWVEFEQGDSMFPVYDGTLLKNTTSPREFLTHTSPVDKSVIPANTPISMGTWNAPIGPETPIEALSTPYEPTTQVLAKTVKGHTIILEERDGFERLRFIDQTGQEIRLSAPVTAAANAGNALQRGMDSSADGDATSYSVLAGAATIDVVGANGQGVRILAAADSESIEIQSNDPNSRLTQNRIRLLLGGGLGTFEVRGTLQGTDQVLFSMDLHSGHVELFAANSVNLQTQVFNILAPIVSLKGDMFIDGNLQVKGTVIYGGEIVGTQPSRKPTPLNNPNTVFPSPVAPPVLPPLTSFFGVGSANPATALTGQTLTITVSGYGLLSTDTYTAVAPDSSGNPVTSPYVTINSVMYVSPEEVQINLTVSPDAPSGYTFGFLVNRAS